MKLPIGKRESEAGFTLIELMIVVGIIGILVAIAIPNFAKYQSKARQSEAKIALAAVYGSEKSFYSEYAAYMGAFDAVGYAPEGQKRFYLVGWQAAPAGNATGYTGTTTVFNYASVNDPFASCGNLSTGDAATTANVQTFIATASGCINNQSTTADTWNITDTKIISNNVVGL